MKRNRKLLIVMTIIMIVITIIAWEGGCAALSTGRLPLGMSDSHGSDPTETGIVLLIFAGLLTLTDVALTAYVWRGRLRNLANVGCIMSWFCGAASFAWGTVNGRGEWLVYLLLTIPPLITWIATGPSIKVGDEAW